MLMKNWIQNEINELQKILNDIKHFEEKAPSGTLRIHNKNGKTYYYRQMKDEEGKMIQQYLPLREMNFIRILAQKSYCKKLKTKAERNLKILQQVEADYEIGWMREIYEEQEYQRKKLITPYLKPEEVVLKEWEEEKYEQNIEYPENLRYETEHGELVRSKSEVLIANMLHQKKDILLYKYERPLKLKKKGKEIEIYPDFTILNKETGRILYWEHAGMMDNISYVGNFIRKQNLYIENYLMPGRDVIFTYESSESPFDISGVKKMIHMMIDETE